MVFKPLSFLFVSFKIYLDFLFGSSYWDNWKGLCLFWDPLSFLCFKSLGLDITSVILNPFKMAATYLFLRFVSIKESYKRLIPMWYTLYRKSFINSKKFSFLLYWKLETLSISISKIYLRSCPNLFSLTLDPCPWEMNQYFLLELHHGLFTLQPDKKRGVIVEQNKRCRAKSIFIPILYKMVDVRIHNGSCLSSRTLLSTTSFQTKFYHNISLIWSQYWIDSIMESWIIIGSVGTC